jgi:hypothetical protein
MNLSLSYDFTLCISPLDSYFASSSGGNPLGLINLLIPLGNVD